MLVYSDVISHTQTTNYFYTYTIKLCIYCTHDCTYTHAQFNVKMSFVVVGMYRRMERVFVLLPTVHFNVCGLLCIFTIYVFEKSHGTDLLLCLLICKTTTTVFMHMWAYASALRTLFCFHFYTFLVDADLQVSRCLSVVVVRVNCMLKKFIV